MRKITGILFLIFLSASFGFGQVKNLNFDFSGIDQFWKVAGILERGRDPSVDDWTALFQTPGYRELMRREPFYSEEFFRNRLGLVFKPSRAEELKETLGKNKSANLAHFAQIKTKKSALDRLRTELESGSLMDEALRKAGEFLPVGATDREASPPVSFIFFDADARGYVPMIIDLALALDKGPQFVELLAHEAHHYYRNRNLAYDEGNVKVKHADLFNSLAQLQMEGLADQIDKHVPYYVSAPPEKSDYADRYRKNVVEAPRQLASYNELFEKMADRPDRISSLPLVQSGHPTGYYMARAIIGNGDLRELIAKAGNPFAFFYLYNKAAMKQGRADAFSRKAIGFLRDLERSYCPNPEETFAVEAMPSGLDVSGIERFWEIADVLGQDKDPAAEEWNRLFANPAYQELFQEGWQTRDSLRESLSLAFKPSRQNELQTGAARNDRTIRHFTVIKEKRAEIDAYIRELKTKEWADGVLADMRSFLPERALRKTPAPIQSLVFFSNDLRYGYSVFILDPYYGMSSKSSAAYYARRHYLQTSYYALWPGNPQDVKQRHADVVDTLDAIALNGILETALPKTGLKRNFDVASPTEKTEAERIFREAYAPSLQSLKRLDERLRMIDQHPNDDEAWAAVSVRDFPLDGRPAGVLMRKAIADILGQERLSAVFGDPFGFFLAYQEAAQKQPARYPAFSGEAIRVIEALKKEVAARDSRDPG